MSIPESSKAIYAPQQKKA